VSVSVMAHVDADTVIRSRVHAAEDRVTVRLEGERGLGSDVTLFARRPELVRFRDALTAVLADLDDQCAALAESAAHPVA
jgi:hypothetical protein